MIFVDTSAVIAVLDEDQPRHRAAAKTWQQIIESEELVTTSYVLVELFALVQRRLGLDAVRVLDGDLLPLIDVVWIDDETHRLALAAVFASGRRQLSLVDCASFEMMRRRGLRTAFTLDRHFAQQGFTTIP